MELGTERIRTDGGVYKYYFEAVIVGLVIAATNSRLGLWYAAEMPRHTTGSRLHNRRLPWYYSLADTGPPEISCSLMRKSVETGSECPD